MGIDITFDPAKDAENLRKHGISLRRAEEFDFDSAYYDLDDREDYGEQRFTAVGFLDARLYTLVLYRAGRFISSDQSAKVDKEGAR